MNCDRFAITLIWPLCSLAGALASTQTRSRAEVDQLVGKWKLTEAPPEFGLDPGATATFRTNGELIYTIPEAGRLSVIRLIYRVVGDQLITNQPSAPREEATGFRLEGDRLFLTHDGLVAIFSRQPF